MAINIVVVKNFINLFFLVSIGLSIKKKRLYWMCFTF